ncbi:MAG: hypothetical protein ASARMPRED_002979 [Alectoria sarmentosa]|nr:MAG: hypothetical protein ASARMPRED_002979 [Alectoria sarmentosa]
MVYLNPGGFDFGSENLDGYGISNIVFIVMYSLCFYSACLFTWIYRHHPVLRMRNVPLMLLSVLTMHVFTFAVFVVYTMNGAFPCQVEYWCMCLYLPIGIGLYQAYNQQLLIVSRGQAALITKEELFKPIFPRGKGFGGPKYWAFRFKIWWQNVSTKGKYEGFVLIGIVIQFTVSFIIYNISRKFNHYGIVDHHTSPGLCRRGWEWVPTIIWQFSWNYIFGPYLLWNIRMIKDIYHWRLQTTLAIIAGLPGAPMWLVAVYSDKFAPVNKYWLPSEWLIPGLMTIEVVTLGFPIYAIFKNKKAAREVNNALADFDQKHLQSFDEGTTLGGSGNSLQTKGSTKGSKKKGKMYPMESLDACLSGNHDGLQVYASCMELNGENIIFLTKVIAFTQQCQKAFYETCKSTSEFRRARTAMFRVGLSIFVSLVHSGTASYPINIESNIYGQLDLVFGPATALVASAKASRSPSIATPLLSSSSKITPWDDPADSSSNGAEPDDPSTGYFGTSDNSYPMQPMGRKSSGNDSCEHIVVHVRENEVVGVNEGSDPLEGIKVPAEFDERVFDAAFGSVRFMVWTETWQRYMQWKRSSGSDMGD